MYCVCVGRSAVTLSQNSLLRRTVNLMCIVIAVSHSSQKFLQRYTITLKHNAIASICICGNPMTPANTAWKIKPTECCSVNSTFILTSGQFLQASDCHFWLIWPVHIWTATFFFTLLDTLCNPTFFWNCEGRYRQPCHAIHAAAGVANRELFHQQRNKLG